MCMTYMYICTLCSLPVRLVCVHVYTIVHHVYYMYMQVSVGTLTCMYVCSYMYMYLLQYLQVHD